MSPSATAIATTAPEPLDTADLSRRDADRRALRPWLALAIGIVAFAAVTGGTILSPASDAWLLRADDSAQHYVGWLFFRDAPWGWPLGVSPRFGLELASSVAFTDSLPLVALALKPLRSVLPEAFQYTGLWIAACFALQAWFAMLLLSRWTDDDVLLAAGAGFFVLAPPFLWRLHGHYALLGHWLVLAALALYLRRRFAAWRWLALLAVGSLVHPYLLAMALAVFVGDLAQRLLGRSLALAPAVGWGVAALALVGGALTVAGTFVLGPLAESWGFGHYRLNLLSPFDPDAKWSRALPDLPQTGGDYEGFNYLGLGVLGLGALAALARLVRRRAPAAVLPRHARAVLWALAIALTVFALSDHVALGSGEIVAYPLPSFARRLAGVLRSSGRLFWPVHYLIVTAVVVTLVRRLSRRVALVTLLVGLVVQVADTVPALRALRREIAAAAEPTPTMRAPLWDQVASRYPTLRYVLPENKPERWLPLALFAHRHGMAINTGYFARVDVGAQGAARDRLLTQLVAGGLPRDALYVFASRGLLELARSRAAADDLVAEVEGFRLLAPGMAARREDPALGGVVDGAPLPELGGDWLELARARAEPARSFGWEVGRHRHRAWTRSDHAGLTVRIPVPRGDADLAFDLRALPEPFARRVEVMLNRRPVGSIEIPPEGATGPHRVQVSREMLAAAAGVALIELKAFVSGPAAPSPPVAALPRVGVRGIRLAWRPPA